MKDDVMQGRKELDTNALLVLRTFVNLFDGEEGRELLTREYERVCSSPRILSPSWCLGMGVDGRFLRQVRLELRDRVVNLSKLLSVLFSSSKPLPGILFHPFPFLFRASGLC